MPLAKPSWRWSTSSVIVTLMVAGALFGTALIMRADAAGAAVFTIHPSADSSDRHRDAAAPPARSPVATRQREKETKPRAPVIHAPVIRADGAAPLLRAKLLRAEVLQRAIVARGPEAEALLAIGKKIGMASGPLHNPCRRWVGLDCVESALGPFFRSLDQIASGGQSRVSVFGNSLIASDRIINIWRQRLQVRFGDAGRGLLLVDRMTPYGSRRRTGFARGLASYNVAWGERGPYPHGIAGALNYSRGRARSVFELQGDVRAQLFWLDHQRAPVMELRVDGEVVAAIAPELQRRARITEIALPAGAHQLEFTTQGRAAVLYGLVLQKESPGVTVDTMGVVGADSTRFLREDPTIFAAQLRALDPNLVTMLIGGNEVKRIAYGTASLRRVRRDLHRFIDRVQKAVPDAACLVIGPLENVVGHRGAKNKRRGSWKVRWQTYAVNRVMREVAAEEGCAYFELFKALGETGSLKALQSQDMLHDDMIHPKGRGLDLVGDLISDAILNAYEEEHSVVNEDELRAQQQPWFAALDRSPLAAWDLARRPPGSSSRPLRLWLGKLPAGVDKRVRAVLGQRLQQVGIGYRSLSSSTRRLALEREHTTVDLYWRGRAPKVSVAGRGPVRGKRRTLAFGLGVSQIEVSAASALVVTRGAQSLVGIAARRQYGGAEIDGPNRLPAPIETDRGYALAISGSDQDQAFPDVDADACLSILFPIASRSETPTVAKAVPTGPLTKKPGQRRCAELDPIKITGGTDAWQDRGLLDDEQRFTEEGAEFAAQMIVATLLDATGPTRSRRPALSSARAAPARSQP